MDNNPDHWFEKYNKQDVNCHEKPWSHQGIYWWNITQKIPPQLPQRNSKEILYHLSEFSLSVTLVNLCNTWELNKLKHSLDYASVAFSALNILPPESHACYHFLFVKSSLKYHLVRKAFLTAVYTIASVSSAKNIVCDPFTFLLNFTIVPTIIKNMKNSLVYHQSSITRIKLYADRDLFKHLVEWYILYVI